MKTSETLSKIASAMVAAQREMKPAIKDEKNPFFKSSYATLQSVLDAVMPSLGKHGIALIQGASFDGEKITVSTRLLHESGEWIEETAGANAAKQDAQGAGSVISYLRRYSAMAMCGIPAADDDGNSASHHDPHPKESSHAVDEERDALETLAISLFRALPQSTEEQKRWINDVQKMPIARLKAGVAALQGAKK